MSQTRMFITFLLVGVVSVTFAAPNQTAELEKSNENGDAQDVSAAAKRSEYFAELEEDENEEVQHHSCRYKYFPCHHCYR